jgi:ligand-binding sensor domain-containing protein
MYTSITMIRSRTITFITAIVAGAPLHAQASRNWRPDERALITDLSYVTAVAATRSVVYAATPNGLAVYDRGLGNLRLTVGAMEGYPVGAIVTAMAADPNDDTAWLALNGQWAFYEPFTRRFESGQLPGGADQVILDARDPGRGAWFHTGAGWYQVPRGGLSAMPAHELPANRVGSLNARELFARLPALDAVRLRIERDEQNRGYRMTSAAVAPLTNEIFIGTDGNGAFKVDPVSYATERLPAGLLGSAVDAIAESRGQVCAAGAARAASQRHGIACFDEGAGNVSYIETIGLVNLPLFTTRQLLVTERAVWAATDQGLLRAPRRGGRPVQLGSRNGLPSDRILSIVASPEGAYVGTSEGLALVADTGRAVTVVGVARGPAVLSIAGQREDTVWAGTAAGVVGFLLPLGGPVVMPEGSPILREPVLAAALRGDSILAATPTRFFVQDAGGWRAVDAPGAPIGRVSAITADARGGFWIAGDQGFAFFDPSRSVWNALFTAADVPQPVRGITASRDYVWVATDIGVVRYERRLLVP